MQHTCQHFTPNYYIRCYLNSCYLFGRYIGLNGTHTSHPYITCRVNGSPIRVITPLYINKRRVLLLACWQRYCSPEYARATNILSHLCLNTDCRAPVNPLFSQLRIQFGNTRLYSTLSRGAEMGGLPKSCFRCLHFYFLTLISGIVSYFTHTLQNV